MPKKPKKKTPPPPAPNAYTTADLLRLTSATKGNLIHWSAIQLIRPDIADASGSGHHKRYSALNVVEVEIATTLNEFKIPTALIADGVDGFRLFHEQCVALWNSGPLDGERWTDAQRQAFDHVMVRGFQRRDIRGGAKPSSASYYARSLQDQGVPFEEQRAALQMAGRWRLFLEEPAYRNHFFGLFVNPLEQTTVVADEPVDLQDLLSFAVVVINLGTVLSALADSGAVHLDLV